MILHNLQGKQRVPFSIFHFPFSIFHFPFSIFHFPFSIFHFPFSIFHFPKILNKISLSLVLITSLCITENSYAANVIIDNSGTITTSSSKITGVNSVAIGDNITIDANGTPPGWNVAIGHEANIKGNESVAVGAGAKVIKGWGNTAVGRSSVAENFGSTAIGNWAEARATYSTAIGTSSKATGVYSIAAGIKSQAAGWGSLATGLWSYAGEHHSVALGDYSVTEKAVSTASTEINGTTYNYAGGTAFSTVSVGSQANNPTSGSSANAFGVLYRTITNVAAGRVNAESTDAINGSQLHAVTTEVEKNTAKINALSNITNNIDALDKEMQRGDVMNAALSALKPMAYKPGEPTQIMAGMGNYRGRSAVAVGVAHYFNDNFLAHAGGSYTSGAHGTMTQLGVTYRFGSNTNNKPIKISTSKNNVELRNLADSNRRLEAKLQMQGKQIAEQQARIKRLEEALLLPKNKKK